jgi:putative oxidoreductase
MDRFLGKYAEQIYAVFRFVVGASFALHGAQKLFGVLGGTRMPIVSLMGIAGVIELVTGVLVALGLLAGWAAFIASGHMAVAFFMAHFPKGLLPINNGGELAVLYCFAFLFIAAKGAGVCSLSGPGKR